MKCDYVDVDVCGLIRSECQFNLLITPLAQTLVVQIELNSSNVAIDKFPQKKTHRKKYNKYSMNSISTEEYETMLFGNQIQ